MSLNKKHPKLYLRLNLQNVPCSTLKVGGHSQTHIGHQIEQKNDSKTHLTY